MKSMVHSLATRHWEKWGDCVASWYKTAVKYRPAYMVYNRPMMQAYQEVLENTAAEIIAYIHDDVEIYEQGWDLRVLKEFDDPTIGLVGFAGARGHGSPDLYRQPYKMENFARRNFISNMREAELHGGRFIGETDVAVFDGLALFVRRSILNQWQGWPNQWGGWPQNTPVNYWTYDYAISCETRYQGFRNRLVGVDCHHYGGRSPSIIPEDIEAAHKWIYERYRDVLPYEVG